MATGLDRIIEQILADAEAKAAEQVAAYHGICKKQKRRLRTLPPRQSRKQMSCLRTVKKSARTLKPVRLRPRNSHAAAPCLPQSRTPFAM